MAQLEEYQDPANPPHQNHSSSDDEVTVEPVRGVPFHFARRHEIVVQEKDDGQWHIISPAIPKLVVLNEVQRILQQPVVVDLVDEDTFEAAFDRYYQNQNSDASLIVDDISGSIDLESLSADLPQTEDLLESADDAPVIRLINALLTQALRENASDIHLEAYESSSTVRLRVDGVLREVLTPQRGLHQSLVSRIKVMAHMDIAERRLPQDGRISLRVAGRPVDVRVSTLPTQHGERVVMRLLDKRGSNLNLDKIGMPESIRKRFVQQLTQPHGMILVTGPTGSGKTTSLYSGLAQMQRGVLNIMTVEDPIEYELPGISQTQVNTSVGMTFASGLRSILRQDPDVVLVGEIRDFETAEIAVQASLTGHLVLATLHTNTAIGSITRLVDMGVESFLVGASITGLLAQRLVRVLCPDCVRKAPISEEGAIMLNIPSGTVVGHAEGCIHCDGNGYRGRTGVYELISVSERLRHMISEGQAEHALLVEARKNSDSILQDCANKVLDFTTSVDEVLRVASEQSIEGFVDEV